MKKVRRLVFGMTAAAALLLGSAALASPAFAHNGTVVVKGAGGALVAADGSIFITHTGCMYLSNPSGATLDNCHAQQPRSVPNPTSTVIFNFADTGFQCNANGVITNKWREVVTPSGRVNLTCHG